MTAGDFNLGQGKRRSGGGIGVSALEEDDNDVYDVDDMSSYDRIAGPASTVDADGNH